jgi:hypothetical protein|tara:strand:- start:1828 stop:1944 length:117 start_codon:yes stop_codon:yes gene_type:complete
MQEINATSLQMKPLEEFEITVLVPCFNEEQTIGQVIIR